MLRWNSALLRQPLHDFDTTVQGVALLSGVVGHRRKRADAAGLETVGGDAMCRHQRVLDGCGVLYIRASNDGVLGTYTCLIKNTVGAVRAPATWSVNPTSVSSRS